MRKKLLSSLLLLVMLFTVACNSSTDTQDETVIDANSALYPIQNISKILGRI